MRQKYTILRDPWAFQIPKNSHGDWKAQMIEGAQLVNQKTESGRFFIGSMMLNSE